MYNITLTHDQKIYLEGLIEQEISGLIKCEEYKGEYKEEISFGGKLLDKFYKEVIKK